MTTSEIFRNFLGNLAVDNAEQISLRYDAKKSDYINTGNELTDLFNELKHLYRNAKATDNDLRAIEDSLIKIERNYINISISQQILFSDWYAHYKFFWQHQIGWINEQKHFKFLRDKIPLSLSLTILTITLGVIIWKFDLLSKIYNLIHP
ncbi:MAG: SLATT domain-containing protein [Pseudomonadota bacterium]